MGQRYEIEIDKFNQINQSSIKDNTPAAQMNRIPLPQILKLQFLVSKS